MKYAVVSIVFVLGVGGVALSACSEISETTPAPVQSTQPPSEAAAWLTQAQDAHREADEAILDNDLETAESILREALVEPPETVHERDARVIRQDLYYRLATVLADRADNNAALEAADRGLALGEAEDLFTANLLVVKGRALEALGRDVDAAGIYFQALEINEALLRQTLRTEDEDPGEKAP